MNKPFPYTVHPDSGYHFIDQNGHHIPNAPLLPLFKAVDVVAESKNEIVDWPSVDFVTERNNIRKLLKWARTEDQNGRADDFRIDLQLAGKRTVLMNRWEKTTKCWSSNLKEVVPNYGYNFEKASTRPIKGCENTQGHYRIIQYVGRRVHYFTLSLKAFSQKLGTFNMVVRFEVDAYLPYAGVTAAYTSDSGGTLSDQISRPSMTPASSNNSDRSINIIRAGAYIQQSSIMELKTRTVSNTNQKWMERYPQLFLSQTPHLYFAVHSKGNFKKLEANNLEDPDVKAVGMKLQEGLRRLLSTLAMIQELVIASGKQGRYSLLSEGGKLKVYKRSTQDSCLPEDVLARFES